MRGCRPLTLDESRRVFEAYSGRYKLRNQALHMLCVCTGLRVSEALSLRVGDVVKKGRVVRRVKVSKSNVKRSISGRTIDLPEPARMAIWRQVGWLWDNGYFGKDEWLFLSQYGGRPLGRKEAWRIFNTVASSVGLDEDLGTLGTHCWRKTYADQANRHFIKMSQSGIAINPMLETCRALGHRSIESTEAYLSFSSDSQQSAVRYMGKAHAYGI